MALTTTTSLKGNQKNPFTCVKCRERVGFVVVVDGHGEMCRKCAPPHLVIGGGPVEE